MLKLNYEWKISLHDAWFHIFFVTPNTKHKLLVNNQFNCGIEIITKINWTMKVPLSPYFLTSHLCYQGLDSKQKDLIHYDTSICNQDLYFLMSKDWCKWQEQGPAPPTTCFYRSLLYTPVVPQSIFYVVFCKCKVKLVTPLIVNQLKTYSSFLANEQAIYHAYCNRCLLLHGRLT